MRFNFEKKGYFTDKQEYYKRLDNSLLPSNKNFVEAIRTMIDDLADNNLDKNIQDQYHKQCEIRFSDDVQMIINSYEEEFKKFINDNPKAMKYFAKKYKKQFKKKLKENDINLFYSLMNTVAVNMDPNKAADPDLRKFIGPDYIGGLNATDYFASSNTTSLGMKKDGYTKYNERNIIIRDDWLVSNWIVSKGVSEYKINDYKSISPSIMNWYLFFVKGQDNNPSFGKSFNENLIRWSHYVFINTPNHDHVNFSTKYKGLTKLSKRKGVFLTQLLLEIHKNYDYSPWLFDKSISSTDFETKRMQYCY